MDLIFWSCFFSAGFLAGAACGGRFLQVRAPRPLSGAAPRAGEPALAAPRE
ncbi:MAG: hypothetical protein QF903_11885 [Planctomycetota bacterium]|jgi:hypothetical protein|nr:hypothetical protein [Planctomycetota bacterium]MDP6761650.1 hypothetical protein [Planctomycetota bacterium]MDP6990161.1 hypothetical protein [Planctomycetota bacterium]